MRKFHIEAC